MNRGWSIERVDWEGLEQTLSDSGSWGSVILTTNDQMMVPARPGVYAICAPPPNAVGPGPKYGISQPGNAFVRGQIRVQHPIKVPGPL